MRHDVTIPIVQMPQFFKPCPEQTWVEQGVSATFPGLLMLILKPSHVNYYNFVFVVPSLIENVLIFRLWSRQSYTFNVNFIYVIQQCFH
ncbi:hypothetical protein C8R44DRAFT_885573 [Mycena epipterygia]|nr:hypothetical protein C8R44DRAFT_885573 [Mycena epipterygia]